MTPILIEGDLLKLAQEVQDVRALRERSGERCCLAASALPC